MNSLLEPHLSQPKRVFGGRFYLRQVWSTSVAHDYKYMDLAKTSLAPRFRTTPRHFLEEIRGIPRILRLSRPFSHQVTRVCTGDGALILSTTQATLVEQINSFLSLGNEQLPG